MRSLPKPQRDLPDDRPRAAVPRTEGRPNQYHCGRCQPSFLGLVMRRADRAACSGRLLASKVSGMSCLAAYKGARHTAAMRVGGRHTTEAENFRTHYVDAGRVDIRVLPCEPIVSLYSTHYAPHPPAAAPLDRSGEAGWQTIHSPGAYLPMAR